MADIINLRNARKAKARQAATVQANNNRAAFGRTKAEMRAADLETKTLENRLDGAKLEQD